MQGAAALLAEGEPGRLRLALLRDSLDLWSALWEAGGRARALVLARLPDFRYLLAALQLEGTLLFNSPRAPSEALLFLMLCKFIVCDLSFPSLQLPASIVRPSHWAGVSLCSPIWARPACP